MVNWPDYDPVTPWADPWHDIAADLRAARTQARQEHQRSMLEPPAEDEWIALCAPGRRPWAALSLMLKGEKVTDIRESPLLRERPADIVLVNVARLPDWKLPEAGT